MTKNYLRKELTWEMFKLNYSEPSDFYVSSSPNTECPKTVLVIRCLLLATTIGIVTFSTAYYLDRGSYNYWFIYLTHWGLTLVLFSTLFAVIVSLVAVVLGDIGIVISCAIKDLSSRVVGNEEGAITWYVKIYWVLYNCALPFSILITIFYWAVLFKPGNNTVPPLVLNISEHGVQTVVMLVLLLSSRQPCRLGHFYHSALLGITWTGFSIIYFLSGGLGKDGKPYIYSVVDWTNPAKTVIVVAMTALALIISHFLVVALTELRDWIAGTLGQGSAPARPKKK